MAGYSEYYVRNRYCRCPRCISQWIMGPAMLITIGVLFLLEQLGIMYFDRSWPILLLVAGAVQIARRSASDEGHIQPPQRISGIYTQNMSGTPVSPTTVEPPAAPPSSDSEVNRG